MYIHIVNGCRIFYKIIFFDPHFCFQTINTRCAHHSGVTVQCACHSGVNDTAVHVAVVSMTLLCIVCNQLCRLFSRMILNPVFFFYCENLTWLLTAQWCQWHRYDMHSSIIDTPVTLDLIFERLWVPLKGTSIKKNIAKQIVLFFIYNFHTKIWGLTKDRFCHSGVIDTAVTKIVNFIVDFLNEFKAKF
jgi:hypothetical protein